MEASRLSLRSRNLSCGRLLRSVPSIALDCVKKEVKVQHNSLAESCSLICW